jgi:hypothetical protein
VRDFREFRVHQRAWPLDVVRTPRNAIRQHFGARLGDEHVVFDANPAHVGVTSELFAIERTFEIPDFEQHRNAVEARLDRDGHPGQEVAIEPQVTVAEALNARAPRGVAGAVAEIFHVVNVETEQVTDAVWEK